MWSGRGKCQDNFQPYLVISDIILKYWKINNVNVEKSIIWQTEIEVISRLPHRLSN